jgi:hypothetical protein
MIDPNKSKRPAWADDCVACAFIAAGVPISEAVRQSVTYISPDAHERRFRRIERIEAKHEL